jgi:hypothetical protein
MVICSLTFYDVWLQFRYGINTRKDMKYFRKWRLILNMEVDEILEIANPMYWGL